MTYRHIILQNLKFNMKRFLSYLFVNSFVVAVLFMYGSLLFNEILAEDAAMRMARSYIDGAAYAITLFSIVFVSYTGIYFVKSRGREFGVYLTLGMTRRDLGRMIRFESLVIVAGSVICGLLSGLLFSKLFYMALAKVLDMPDTIYSINYKTYLLSLGVFLIVFLFNMAFTSRFLRKLSILQISKASSTKGVSKPHPIIGGIAILTFGVSLWLYHAEIAGEGWIRNFSADYPLLGPILGYFILVGGIFGSLFLVLAFCIDAIRLLVKRIPALYHRHVLILTNLSHRFNAYKVTLYMVTMLIALAVVFMGFGLSFYSLGQKTMDENVPYDYMIETSGDINRIAEQEIRAIVSENGGTLASFSALEFISGENYRSFTGRLIHQRSGMIMSESQFNRHTGMSLAIAPDELVNVFNVKGYEDDPIDYDTIIPIETWREGIDRSNAFRSNPVSSSEFLYGLGDKQRLTFSRDKTTAIYDNFINSYGTVEFPVMMANVVDDSVFESIAAQRDTVYLFNLKSGDGDRIYSALLAALRAANNADKEVWSNPETKFVDREGATYINRDDVETMRPIYKAERTEIAFRINGFLLFALTFLGFLFLLSSSIVLYYKVATDIDEEKDQAKLLTKLGLTSGEYRAYLRTHLAIIFFAPMVIGGLLGLFLINSTLNFTVYSGYLKSRVLMMYGVFVVFDIFFYLALRRKFVRGIGV